VDAGLIPVDVALVATDIATGSSECLALLSRDGASVIGTLAILVNRHAKLSHFRH
jgi:hypothetical protein